MSPKNLVHSGRRVATAIGLLATAACGPGYRPAGVDLVVRRPPPERVEVVGTAPGSGYVWIRGHYAWQGGAYVWMPGHWETSPQPGYRSWSPGRWAHVRGGWYWVEGHWR